VPVGMYLSRCRGRVDAVLDLQALEHRFGRETAVCRIVDDLFAPTTKAEVLRDIAERGLDGVVLAGHSVDHYERSVSAPELKWAIADAGVNPNRIAFANLLEQVALAHAADAAGAAVKAEVLLAQALEQARSYPAARPVETVPERSVLILGATPAGVVAAQRLLRLGYSVSVADAGRFDASLASAAGLTATLAYVSDHLDSTVLENASLEDGDGWLGDYRVVLCGPGGCKELRVGGILIADGAAWVEQLRMRYPLAVDGDGMPRAVSPGHPARTADPGIMIMPEHDSADLRSIVGAADSAAVALLLRLAVPKTVRYVDTSVVDDTLCSGCASCVKTCAFGACSIDPVTHLSCVDERRCHGCGKCVVSCPVGARDIVSSPHAQMLETIRSMAAADVAEPRVLGFLCGGCGYPAADAAGRATAEGAEPYPASFLPVRIPCGGRLDALYVLEAFRVGFDGVAVFRCREGHCQNLVGNLDMDRRINLLRTVLRSRALDDARLRIIDISPEEAALFTEEVNGFFSDLSSLALAEGSAR
jgi:F420-non-reducing hydrogenase iron-sulfur subunit